MRSTKSMAIGPVWAVGVTLFYWRRLWAKLFATKTLPVTVTAGNYDLIQNQKRKRFRNTLMSVLIMLQLKFKILNYYWVCSYFVKPSLPNYFILCKAYFLTLLFGSFKCLHNFNCFHPLPLSHYSPPSQQISSYFFFFFCAWPNEFRVSLLQCEWKVFYSRQVNLPVATPLKKKTLSPNNH